MSKKIIFFGNERLATGVVTTAPVLRALIAAGYELAAVVVHHESGLSRKPRELEIAEVAAQHQIPVLAPPNLSDIAEPLAAYGAQAAVLVAFGKIVPQSIIDIFPCGIVNIHPSLLPKHRGPIPVERVLLSGEQQTGVSLIRLTAKMDAGPLYAQQMISLSGNETKQQLADSLAATGQVMLLDSLPAILNGTLEPIEQDDESASYDQLITKETGKIDWHKPAIIIEREVRAYAGWPKSRTDIGGRDVVITAAHVIPGNGTPGVIYLEGKQIGMHTTEGILIIDRLKPAGKQEMTGSDFLLGYSLAS